MHFPIISCILVIIESLFSDHIDTHDMTSEHFQQIVAVLLRKLEQSHLIKYMYYYQIIYHMDLHS